MRRKCTSPTYTAKAGASNTPLLPTRTVTQQQRSYSLQGQRHRCAAQARRLSGKRRQRLYECIALYIKERNASERVEFWISPDDFFDERLKYIFCD
jgi:hypothetical protein